MFSTETLSLQSTTTLIELPSKAYARGSGGSTCCGECAPVLLSSLADQDVVWNRSGAGADAEESIERRMPCAAPIEAEHELVQVVLVLSFAGRGKRPGPSA